jgi:hypothetical protein
VASGMGRGRLQGLIIMMLFFGPVLAAFMIYFSPGQIRPAGSTAHGELLDPMRTLPPFEFTTVAGEVLDDAWLGSKWWLMYFNPNSCEARCLADLASLSKMRVLLSKERDRLGYTLMTTGPRPADLDDDGLLVGWPAGTNGGEVEALMREVSRNDQRLFIVDPRRNLVLRYPVAAEPGGVLEDVERLLKLSRIG